MFALPDFSLAAYLAIALIFVWTGFVRTGIGFGGAALGLPLLLLVYPEPVFWLPIIGFHLLFFSGITLLKRLRSVDWSYLGHSLLWICPPTIVGAFSLVSIPALWVSTFIYVLCLFYGIMWFAGKQITSKRLWVDRLLLVIGGYAGGTTLSGAPLVIAVFMKNVARHQFRNTLFVLWFVMVTIKLTTFVALSVPLQFGNALMLLPIAAIGHVIGLKLHERILQNDRLFKRWIGAVLAVISVLSLYRLLAPLL